MNESLLEILCCPETHQPLRPAQRAVVDRVNAQISGGTLKNRGGKPVTEPIEEALVREDGKYLYAIRKNIPVMLIDEAIAVS